MTELFLKTTNMEGLFFFSQIYLNQHILTYQTLTFTCIELSARLISRILGVKFCGWNLILKRNYFTLCLSHCLDLWNAKTIYIGIQKVIFINKLWTMWEEFFYFNTSRVGGGGLFHILSDYTGNTLTPVWRCAGGKLKIFACHTQIEANGCVQLWPYDWVGHMHHHLLMSAKVVSRLSSLHWNMRQLHKCSLILWETQHCLL